MTSEEALEILLVDDDSDLYDYYVILMNKHFSSGVRLHHCPSGEDLADALDDRDYDIVILDQRLKDGEHGLDLVPTIRRANPDSIILLNSAYGSEMLAADAIRRGVDDYIEGRKEDKEALIAAIERAAPVVHANREVQRRLHEIEEGRKAIREECTALLNNIKRKIGTKLIQP